METLESIYTRRSVRKYNDQKISDEMIKKLLKAAFLAPSAGNQQPWHFVIIDDKKILEKIPDFHPRAEFIKNSQKSILVCADKNLETFKDYFPLDCSASTENILIAARSLGLGACWVGIYPKKERIERLRGLLNIPENAIPFSIVALGYTSQEQKEVDRYKEDRIHHNKW